MPASNSVPGTSGARLGRSLRIEAGVATQAASQFNDDSLTFRAAVARTCVARGRRPECVLDLPGVELIFRRHEFNLHSVHAGSSTSKMFLQRVSLACRRTRDMLWVNGAEVGREGLRS